VNGNLATLKGPFFSGMFSKPKEAFIAEVVDRYIQDK
jgi:hypothetical protein